MQGRLRYTLSSIFFSFCFVLTLTIMTLARPAFGQTESVLYTFTGGSDGSGPFGNVILDAAGNLYGTTDAGGVDNGNGGYGVVYELSPVTGGGWKETVLYAFAGGSDGRYPFAGLVFDASGNLYGTTYAGGAHNLGTVYELSPVVGGGWSEKILYSFSGSPDGESPQCSLIFDASGNLYGTTPYGGADSLGNVFELSPTVGGAWTENVLLTGTALYGGTFDGNLSMDNAGNLYAVAATGGSSNAGSVYRLTHTVGGWHHGVIYTFEGTPGDDPDPIAGVTFRAPNYLFGVTEAGGSFDMGTAYQLIRGVGGNWSETTVHDFGVSFKDVLYPTNELVIDATGHFYGTSGSGGKFGSGTAFELEDNESGWQERILHSFGGTSDLGGPAGSVVLNGAGNLFGASHNGGAFGAGGVYEITP